MIYVLRLLFDRDQEFSAGAMCETDDAPLRRDLRHGSRALMHLFELRRICANEPSCFQFLPNDVIVPCQPCCPPPKKEQRERSRPARAR